MLQKRLMSILNISSRNGQLMRVVLLDIVSILSRGIEIFSEMTVVTTFVPLKTTCPFLFDSTDMTMGCV
jgi:hypothetical protein